jgi:hypothetical protein
VHAPTTSWLPLELNKSQRPCAIKTSVLHTCRYKKAIYIYILDWNIGRLYRKIIVKVAHAQRPVQKQQDQQTIWPNATSKRQVSHQIEYDFQSQVTSVLSSTFRLLPTSPWTPSGSRPAVLVGSLTVVAAPLAVHCLRHLETVLAGLARVGAPSLSFLIKLMVALKLSQSGLSALV